MICLIVEIILIILFVIMCILEAKCDCDIGTTLFGFLIITIIIMPLFSYGIGYTKADHSQGKHDIELLLTYELNVEHINQAKEYNELMDYGNNLWCRFSIEDRSDLYIDIDKFIKEK